MLNSVLGFAGVSAEGEQDAASRAQAISAILPALRIPLSMIRLLSHLQHCANARRCPSQIITVDIVCNIHMMTASRARPGSVGKPRRLGGRASKASFNAVRAAVFESARCLRARLTTPHCQAT